MKEKEAKQIIESEFVALKKEDRSQYDILVSLLVKYGADENRPLNGQVRQGVSQPVFACGNCEDCEHYDEGDEQCTNENFGELVSVPFVPLPVDFMTKPKYGCILFEKRASKSA
ncbi:MAG: hypothetical protein ABIJ40_04090 [Bacteroidota bacterium]